MDVTFTDELVPGAADGGGVEELTGVGIEEIDGGGGVRSRSLGEERGGLEETRELGVVAIEGADAIGDVVVA